MKTTTILLALAFSTNAMNCSTHALKMPVSARTGIFNINLPQTNLEATTFIQNLTRQGRNFTNTVLLDYQTTASEYDISFEYCQPHSDNQTVSSIAQILTHGIGFDKTYWNSPLNDYNYSYVKTAVDEYGFSTLAYDRLGIGLSSHGEPLSEIQASLEIAALVEITHMLRNGSIAAIVGGKAPAKIFHVGHSFGSAQTYSLANMYPAITDGVILTGFSLNASFVGEFGTGGSFVQARTNQPLRLGNMTVQSAIDTLNMLNIGDILQGVTSLAEPPFNYPSGYLTNAEIGNNQLLFFLPGYFAPEALQAAEATKQPVTPGELLTLGSLSMTNAFEGPTLVFTGSNDLPYCGGDCLATGDNSLASIPAAAAKSFANEGHNVTVAIQPNCGHSINFHYNQTAAFRVVNDFVQHYG